MILNYPTGIMARHFNHDISIATFEGNIFDTKSLKNFLGNFPVFNCSGDPRVSSLLLLSQPVVTQIYDSL